MGILDRFKINNKTEISKPITEKRKIFKTVFQQTLLRTTQDIQSWRDAVDRAESKTLPDRTELMRIYKDVVLDGHIYGIMTSIKNVIKSRKFGFYNSEGEELPEWTEVINQEWFFNFIDSCIDSKFYGYALLQIDGIKDGTLTGIEEVPREYIVPEWRIVKKSLYTASKTHGIQIDSNQYKNWVIFIDNKDLGLLNIAAPHAISKKALFASAWEHAEVFGMPLRVGKTDLNDNDRRLQMENMLSNMGSAAWAVLDETDNVDFHSNGSNDIYKIYIEPMRFSNNEISKAFAGQGMTFDDGSSRSQAEVHERLFEQFITSYMRFITFVVQNKLIPILRYHGLISDEVKKFKFTTDEHLTLLQKKEIIKDIAPMYNVPASFVSNYLQIEAEDKEAETSVPENSVILNKTYTDYPKAATNNAKKVLKWKEEKGDEVKGMTRVGWTRANQLAKRKPISFETIKRMSAFVRHKDNAKIAEQYKSEPWKDNGYVAWLGWGGDEGINWAIKKVEQIEKKSNLMSDKINELYNG